MGRERALDPKTHVALSLPSSYLARLDGDARRFGFPSRSALVQAFFAAHYSKFLRNLNKAKKDDETN
jgi:hypothetical protein